MKYSVIGGNPFVGYTGTMSFTALRVVGQADTQEQVEALIKEHYEPCGGLLLVIDLATGKEANLSCGFCGDNLPVVTESFTPGY
jgi:hypothetical protein